jgi:electron transport complex protein RnfG
MSGKTQVGVMLKLGVILAAYAAAACVGLAFVYAGTSGIIAERQKQDQNNALEALFPDADEFPVISGDIRSPDPSVTFDVKYEALKGGRITGIALGTSRASYGGVIRILVGVGAEGKIAGIKILEHKDTPGLGANAASESYYIDRAAGLHFYDQFAGKSLTDPFVVKEDVVAVTASTVTSQAVAASVKAAGEAAAAYIAAKRGPR